MYELYRLNDLIGEWSRSAELWSGEWTDQESSKAIS